MSANGTKISDIIVPEVFNKYIIERTAARSALLQSGIMAAIPGIVVPHGGTTIKLPNWKDLDSSGDLEVLSDTVPLTPNKISTDKQIAVVLARGKAWSANDLSSAFSGDDPMGAIADLVAKYLARKMQKELLAILDGVFKTGGALNATHVNDISALAGNLAIIKNDDIIDTLAKLGDMGGELSGIVCHSSVMYDLAKKKLLDAKGGAGIPGDMNPELQTYLGRKIIVDDSLAPTGGIYPTYLFASGAIGYAEGGAPHPTETDRDILAGDDVLTVRRHFIMHPYGMRWVGTPTGSTPSQTELSTVGNWQKVFETKNIRMVKLAHKIGALA